MIICILIINNKFIKMFVLILSIIYLCNYDNSEPDLEVLLIKNCMERF